MLIPTKNTRDTKLRSRLLNHVSVAELRPQAVRLRLFQVVLQQNLSDRIQKLVLDLLGRSRLALEVRRQFAIRRGRMGRS